MQSKKEKYEEASKFSVFNAFAGSTAGTTVGAALASALGVTTAGASFAIGLVSALVSCFGWYSIMVDTYARSSRNGCKITFFSNGEVYAAPR